MAESQLYVCVCVCVCIDIAPRDLLLACLLFSLWQSLSYAQNAQREPSNGIIVQQMYRAVYMLLPIAFCDFIGVQISNWKFDIAHLFFLDTLFSRWNTEWMEWERQLVRNNEANFDCVQRVSEIAEHFDFNNFNYGGGGYSFVKFTQNYKVRPRQMEISTSIVLYIYNIYVERAQRSYKCIRVIWIDVDVTFQCQLS